jgi:PIN domain nuclease of toxin-antitoxin system
VRFLLDTHALLWALAAPARLPLPIVTAIRDPSNPVYVSAASVWEIAIKKALGKLTADLDDIVRSVEEAGFEELAVTMLHARRVFALPLHHRDPFDRMLVAQAFEEGLTVVTRDPSFAAYRIPTAWG